MGKLDVLNLLCNTIHIEGIWGQIFKSKKKSTFIRKNSKTFKVLSLWGLALSSKNVQNYNPSLFHVEKLKIGYKVKISSEVTSKQPFNFDLK